MRPYRITPLARFALVLANAAMEVMRGMMKDVRIPEESFTEHKRH